ncbi:MAG: magnetosome protein MamT [Alphaproteobacteria bacterium]
MPNLFDILARIGRLFGPRIMAGVLALFLVGVLLVWGGAGNSLFGITKNFSPRVIEGQMVGRLAGPTDPSMFDSIAKFFTPQPQFRLMTIRHIPRIKMGVPMPHPFVGTCQNCHLYVGGPGPGNQFKTPVGAVLEELSRVRKLGPPLLPTSQRPHPPAGRCIKCHDIVVKVPVEKGRNGLMWVL